MKSYTVNIIEKNYGNITVDAESEEEAIEVANEHMEDIKWFTTEIEHMEAIED